MDEKLIEAAAKKIAETFFKATAWEELFQSVRDGCIQAARDASAVLSDEPSYKKCGKVAQTFIAREGSFFPCALEEGHQGNCLQSGTCFRHGVYFGKNCPHWPTCAADALERVAVAELDADYDKLVDSLQDAFGDELLRKIVDPIIGFVPEDLQRAVAELRAENERLLDLVRHQRVARLESEEASPPTIIGDCWKEK